MLEILIEKKEDETPNELVFLLRVLLVCSLVLDCLQCYGVGDKDPRSYMPWGQGFSELHTLGSGITWFSPVNLGNADSVLGRFAGRLNFFGRVKSILFHFCLRCLRY